MGETVREGLVRKRIGDRNQLVMFFFFFGALATGTLPFRVRGRFGNGGEKAQSGSHLEEIDDTNCSGEIYAILGSSLLGMHST